MSETDRRTKKAALFSICAAVALSGCAGGAVKQMPPVRIQAIAHNQRGIEAQAAGRMESALAEFSEAQRLHASVENTDGVIVSLVNIARTHRLKGNLPAARGAIDGASLLLQEPSDLAAEVFFEKAKLLLAAGDPAAAETWAARAESAEKGNAHGVRKNLVASLSFRRGLVDQAREQADAALKLNRSEGHSGEVANSLRLLGEMHLSQDRPEMARTYYDEALTLDKDLCLSRKIAMDLRGLGQSALKTGDMAGAIAFYRRAMTVSLNEGDTALAGEDTAHLTRLSGRMGDAQLSEKTVKDKKKP